MRRPNASIDAALEQIKAWMDETRGMVDVMRKELEGLRRERVELIAQLRFACENANREVFSSAELRIENDRLRAELAAADHEDISDEISLDELHDSIRARVPSLVRSGEFDVAESTGVMPWRNREDETAKVATHDG